MLKKELENSAALCKALENSAVLNKTSENSTAPYLTLALEGNYCNVTPCYGVPAFRAVNANLHLTGMLLL